MTCDALPQCQPFTPIPRVLRRRSALVSRSGPARIPQPAHLPLGVRGRYELPPLSPTPAYLETLPCLRSF